MPRSGQQTGESSRHMPLMPRNSNGKRPASSVAIELSSDDEMSRMPPKAVVKRKRTVPTDAEVLEISSDEDESPPLSIPEPIRKQLAKYEKLQKDHAKLKKVHACEVADLESALAEIRQQASSSSKLDPKELDDSVSCAICTAKMWSPYMLDCGHMFCSSCLEDWFQTTLTNHAATNAAGNNPYVAQVNAIMHTHRHNPALQAQLMRQYQHLLPSEPDHTCPSCREKVKRKPIEAFGLKEIVRKVAAAQGESSPRKQAPGPAIVHRRGRGRPVVAPPAARVDPFAKFFK